jgi:hypothetical protein
MKPMRCYSAAVMDRRYQPEERMTFSNGRTVMTAEAADRFTWGLVELDRETGLYRRVQGDPGHETAIIGEAKYREALLRPVREADPGGNRLR